MPKLIVDVETVGEDFDSLDETTQDSLTRWIKKKSKTKEEYAVELQDLKEGLGFSPLTGQIVAIGVLDYDKCQGAVYYHAGDDSVKEQEEEGIKFKPMSEKEMLENFWKVATRYDEFITFNGRGFDAPFLIARSAYHRLKPTRDLMSNRYLESQRNGVKHIDLFDQLSFYGAVQRKGNLHLWCRHFGIKSPKADGVTGDDVAQLFKEKRFLDIAKYNVGDLRATRALYEYWRDYIRA